MQHLLFEKLSELKCDGMKLALQEQLDQISIDAMSFEERLLLLLDREITCRSHRRLQLRLKQAKLKQMACIENVDFRLNRGFDKAQILSLASCQWIKEHCNVLLVGATGTGKSYLACALGHKACLEGFSASYLRLARLLQDLLIAKGDGRYGHLMHQLSKTDVLILALMS